jgi:hypothetical protein
MEYLDPQILQPLLLSLFLRVVITGWLERVGGGLLIVG